MGDNKERPAVDTIRYCMLNGLVRLPQSGIAVK